MIALADDALLELLAGLPPDPARLEAFLLDFPASVARRAAFDGAAYCRQTLARTPAAELVLVGWLPGQETPVHGHGRSCGAMRILSGVLREERYLEGAAGLDPEGWTLARPGAVLREPVHRIHRVRNPSRARAVSLHVYTPPLVTAGDAPRLADADAG